MVSCIILDGPPQLGSQTAASRSPDIPYSHYCELAQGQGLAAFRNEWSKHPLAQLRTQDPEAHALLARMLARYPGRDLTAGGERGDAASPPERFESVNRPILVINGEFDLESRRRFARQLNARFRRVESAVIPDAGHLCSLDNPDAYNNVLRQFLARHSIPANTL